MRYILYVQGFTQLTKQLALLFVKFFRGKHEEGNQLVTPANAVQVGDSLVLELEYLPCLTTCRYFYFCFPVQRGYFNFCPQGSLDKVYRQLVDDIIAVAGKKFVGQDGYIGIDVTRGATPVTNISLAADTYPGAVINTGRDFDQNFTLMLFIAGAVALGAWLGDDSTLTSTPVAGGPGLEAAKNACLNPAHLSRTVTLGAAAWLAARLGTSALAIGTVFQSGYVYFILATEGSVFKGYVYIVVKVSTALRCLACGCGCPTEEGVKNITKPAKIKALKALSEKVTGAGVSKAVIGGTLVRVGEYLIGFTNFLELLRGTIFMVAVRVILES